MNKLKYALLFIFLSTLLYSQERAGYSFKDVGTWYDVAGPKRWLFGNSTVLHDSTNYLTINKSLYVLDSMKVAKDLYVGTKGGVIYLDTNREGVFGFSGNQLFMYQYKDNGGFDLENLGANAGFNFYLGEQNSKFTIGKYRNSSGVPEIFVYDTTALTIAEGNIQFSSSYSPQQVKINGGDSAFTDYDANDAITCNLQSGRLTTKALTTAAGSLYALTLTNSLITANSKIFASLNDGTSTQGLTLLYQCRPGSGSGTIVIYNGHSADAFNGTLIIYFFIVNSP